MLSALEQSRLDNIARNNAFLAQLNIVDVNISNTHQLKAASPRKRYRSAAHKKRYRSRKHESDDSDSDYVAGVDEEEDEKEKEGEEE